jgi:hypothetical protein
MDNDKYDISDLVVSAIEQKPLDFEQAFDDLIIGRIQDAIHDKKVQIAQQMYGYSAESEDEFDDETEEEYSEEE